MGFIWFVDVENAFVGCFLWICFIASAVGNGEFSLEKCRIRQLMMAEYHSLFIYIYP